MSPRLNPVAISPELYKAYYAFSQALTKGGIDQRLRDLVHIRASQINGCAFCVDMHIKEATIHGERPLRIHHLVVWRESPLFDARERAALAWTESVTRLGEHGVPDDIYEEARAQFSEKELVDLTFTVMEINGWNRISIAFRNQPGALDEMLGLSAAGLS
ncbi:MAG TPA: carboxymuconolactone decarboxylase family protein [Rhizomicrobium sp.]|jgi:AhpD family alkylhydroperoxidase|nr:carboxymuconolactone decarboxylase family protein [Rhizomicrobium sp.]